MPAKPKLGLVAICDAVYKDEQSNKPILAGVFSGDILVSAFPAELRVALYIEIQIPEPGPHEVDIQFHVGGKLLGGGKSQPTSAVKNETTMLLLQGVTLLAVEPLEIQVRVALDGGPATTAIKKRVLLKSSAPDA